MNFYTTDCPTCEKLAPVYKNLSERCESHDFLEVNLDEDITLAELYGTSHVPTLMLFENGKPASAHTGYLDIDDLTAFIKGAKEASARKDIG